MILTWNKLLQIKGRKLLDHVYVYVPGEGSQHQFTHSR
jgi:hypothetical protein